MLRWFRAALGSRPLEALNALENIRVIHPDTVFFRYKRAQLEMAANRPHSAIRDLTGIPPEELYRLMGGADWRPANNLTNAQHVVGGFSTQLQVAREAEARYPDVLDFRAQEAAALVALGRVPDLEPVLGAATGVATRPGTATQVEMKCLVVEELRAHGYQEASERLAAQALAECQSESRPASAQARFSKALLLSHLGRAEEALAIYRKLAAEDQQDVGPKWAAGALLARLGRVDEARRIETELATTSFPHLCGENSYGRACIAAQLGERDRAVTLLGKAFEQGWYFSNGMHRELFLEPLHGYPSYEALLKAKD
jgi:tetratricopeptide (TPR) repeat protein